MLSVLDVVTIHPGSVESMIPSVISWAVRL
jgi:hypothetical protein